MRARISSYFTLISVVLVSTLVLWLPFLLRVNSWLGLDFTGRSLLTIYQHFDGPLYIVAAKTLYNPDLIRGLLLEQALEPIYFAAHLPAYPVMILFFSPVFGFLKSMLIMNVLATMALVCFFYYFLKHFNLTKYPLIVATVFLFLPRFLVIRSIGAPETMFMLFILASLFFFEKKNFWLAGLFGGLATATKTPGILLFAAYGLVLLELLIREKRIEWKAFPIVLIPLSMVGVFSLYLLQYGDFFAYFHTNAVVPLVSPFAVFNSTKEWVGTVWLEEIIFYYFIYALTAITLFRSKHRSLFYFSVVFFVATLFVLHRDISRYSLPLWPIACIAFEKYISSKKFLIAATIILPGIYLYAWNFLLSNILPIANWAPFLP